MAIQLIGREELKEKLDRGDNFKLVNALGEWAFRAKRIPGSIRFNTPEEATKTLGIDEEIVVYCSGLDCIASVAAYYSLVKAGYKNVRRFAGGLQEWEAAGYPLEGDMVE
ncbi:MAG: rhodanese-like domain-containing protein [Chloroflexota bacterium]